jgi:hypothetical protein
MAKEFDPLPPFEARDPVVEPSPDSKVRDPPAPELNNSPMKEAVRPNEDDPAVNKLHPNSISIVGRGTQI